MKIRNLLAATALATTLAAPTTTLADSQLSTGGAGTTAEANLDFRIIIPNFVFFQIGTLASVDRIDFDLTAAPIQPGAGAAVSATGGVGDGVDGAVTVNLITNASSISIGASGGDLTNAATDTIPFADITAADGGTIPVPDFGATVSPFAPGGFSLTDTWSYTYDNSSVYNAGTYDGRAVYTITVL